MKNRMEYKEARSFFKPLKYMITFVLLAVVLLTISKPITAFATSVSGPAVNVSVNYIDETATVSSGPAGSTKFYISIDKQKTWEDIPLEGGNGVVDISGLLSSKAVEIYFKGNKDTGVKTYTLLAEPNTVTAAYVVKYGSGYIDYKTTSTPVEYRKGPNGQWKIPPVSFPTAIYEIKGATLQFRSVATKDIRAGKVITVKIPKRPAPPSVKVDGSKLLISGIKANETQYYDPNPAIGWKYVTTDKNVKTISLYDLAKISSTAYNTPLTAGAYEFRNYVPDKKVISGAKLVEVPLQPTCPTSMKIEGSTVTITDDAKRAYEYCKLSSTTPYNAATMKWSSIQANKPTIISKASVSDIIYVRLKSTVDKQTKVVTPASTCVVLTVNSITTK
ncbi:MAG: hypothetical protein K0S76_3073 [Herbinix sp.]|jgi:hypothetical protein|nr:hypothetical protein [Herbinix sp.]